MSSKQKVLKIWEVPEQVYLGHLNAGVLFVLSEDKKYWNGCWERSSISAEGMLYTFRLKVAETYGDGSGWEAVRKYAIRHLIPTLESSKPYFRFKDLDLT